MTKAITGLRSGNAKILETKQEALDSILWRIRFGRGYCLRLHNDDDKINVGYSNSNKNNKTIPHALIILSFAGRNDG